MATRPLRNIVKTEKIRVMEDERVSKKEKMKRVATSSTPTSPSPKKTKKDKGEKCSKHREDYDWTRFRDSKAEKDFETQFKQRGVIRDRLMRLQEEDCPHPDIRSAMLSRGWQYFNKVLGQGYHELTREFYSNFRANAEDEEVPYSSYVRGATIPLSAEIISKALKLPIVENVVCEYTKILNGFTHPDNKEMVDRVLRVCCQEGTTFETTAVGAPKFVRKNSLLDLPMIWCQYILSSLQPVAHSTEVVVRRMVLIYCLMENLYVDLGSLILSEMVRARYQKAQLPYCSIVSLLAKKFKVKVHEEGCLKVKMERSLDNLWVKDRIDYAPVREPRPPRPQPYQPPVLTMSNMMNELQAIKRMQLGMYDMVMNHDILLRRMATALQLDSITEFKVPTDRDQWLASIGFTTPPMEPTQPIHTPVAQDEPMMEAEEEAEEGDEAD